ncbi:PREDICTED: uncharacterized protein LOC106298017 [Brassica oleracea var. oleracea]|uniref:uncharacterized protein LOC106298017 n=1 Tax=Brassica oleracea var. oleracea TaxID=109376 RepID=UPI0006A6AC78|nr:PREDICTED: uncharacterized protein LOC106298017 [Brassica oleracea var. oleracea]
MSPDQSSTASSSISLELLLRCTPWFDLIPSIMRAPVQAYPSCSAFFVVGISLIGKLWILSNVYESVHLGEEAENEADLLTQIRLVQGEDEALVKMLGDEVVGVIGRPIARRICVPNNKESRKYKKNVLKEAHQSKYSIHVGATKMYHDLKRYYQLSGMKRDVAGWLAKCPTCQLVKAEYQVPSGLLQSLSMFE